MEQLDPYFLEEATEMLQIIEEKLVMLLEEKTIDRVHTLLRSAHTLKGSAASMGLETIHTIAHHLEDVFEALYAPELEIDPELGSLLLDGYECLRTPLNAILSGTSYDEEAILNKTASVFALLQNKLGDFFGREAPMPSSEELGFDVVGSIFKDSVPQDLQQLEDAIANSNEVEIDRVLRSGSQFFLNLGASYNLPGLELIARSIISALEKHPEQILEIAVLAYENLYSARAAVLAGDRNLGGEVSQQLRALAGDIVTSTTLSPANSEPKENSLSTLAKIKTLAEEPEPEVIFTTENEPEQEPTPQDREAKVISSSIIPRSEDATLENEKALATNNPLDRILQSIAIAEPQKSLRSKESYFADLPQNPPPQITKDSIAKAYSNSIKVTVEELDSLSQTLGELSIEENQQNLSSETIYRATQQALQQFLDCQRQLRKISEWCDRNLLLSQSRKHRVGHLYKHEKIKPLVSVRVDDSNGSYADFDPLEMDAYSDLHLLVQRMNENMMLLGQRVETIENVINQSIFRADKRKKLLSSAIDDLFASRTIPIGTLLNRFPRLLQQMVAANNKRAELKLFGIEVKVDKAICDKLYEPLLHLIRNAYDHGIETREIRQQQGKAEIGEIKISAYHQGNRTTIEVRDDGKGLNWDKIRRKAIERHILEPNEAESASQGQLAEVLFEPGFSTADRISELSGRGIGLDVVRTQLQELDGEISIRSISGEGTTFTLQLPLNLTTARLLICRSQNITYALLTRSIEQIVLPRGEQIRQQNSIIAKGSQNAFVWQKGNEQPQLIPIFPLGDLIVYQCPIYYRQNNPLTTVEQPKNKVSPLLILENESELYCLQVEEILSEQELVIKTLNDNSRGFPSYVQGYSVLGDGNLTLVIDPSELLAEANFKVVLPKITSLQATLSTTPETEQQPPLALKASLEEPAPPQFTQLARIDRNLTVLVIEDSAFQRQNVVKILSKAGYQVLQASNGSEAIGILEEHREINFVVCDIEMPVMNGFEFLEFCRLDPRFVGIPVVMLTSRSNTKHRQAAFALGAKGYHTKPCTDRELLETLNNIIPRSQ